MKRTYVFNGSSVVEKPTDQGVYAPPKAYWTDAPTNHGIGPVFQLVRTSLKEASIVMDGTRIGELGTEAMRLDRRLAALEAFAEEVRKAADEIVDSDEFFVDVHAALAALPERS